MLRSTILDVLLRIDEGSGYSHLLVDKAIKTNRISSKDGALLTEIVYGTIQRKITLDYYINSFVNDKKKLDSWVRMLLRMSIYQMVFLDKVPDHAIIHEAVEIAKQRGHKGIASFVNGTLRTIQRKGVPNTSLITDDLERLAINTSHPKWLIQRWVNQYGYNEAKTMCEANLRHKPISVRVQPLKLSPQEAVKKLQEEGYEVVQSTISNQGIIVKKGNILQSKLFKAGMLTIQDQSSMLVGEMLDAKPGMHVLDTCSAPGGKVTHIAEKMKNEGTIMAHDLHKKKINLINAKANELDLSIIHAEQADARNLRERYGEAMFDRILVDAPCSGLGVIRGKPDIKYHKQVQDIHRLAKIQLAILNEISPLLKTNGLLMYSTCTVDKEENEEVVKAFLDMNLDYTIDPSFFKALPSILKTSPGITTFGLQIFPQTLETDGFFLTRFKKTGEL